MVRTNELLLDGLNPSQREAVQHIAGPLLIVAGPGSGKTRVITHRAAYLCREAGVPPRGIAAVTFTNRAAKELKTRLDRLMGLQSSLLYAGTFHALCASILRADGSGISIQPDFVIMDDDDQIGLVKRAMLLLNLDPKKFPPRSFLAWISRAKSHLLGPESAGLPINSYYEEIAQKVYAEYEGLLNRSHGLDFDDLLLKTVSLFRTRSEVLAKYQERFLHLMVDEFQDTNLAQSEITRCLGGKHRNICVVGDPDQAIYSWRNADVRNILDFKNLYPDAKMINLSENYRSTGIILGVAQKLIASNTQRLGLELHTNNEDGFPVTIAEAFGEDDEAEMVVKEVDRLTRFENLTLRDCAVTFRVNAQSRSLEEACLRYGVPYKLIGGVRFYQRREIKDVVAYLRLIQDPYDEASIGRVINVPARGIGKKTVDELGYWARSLNVPLYTALQLLAHDEELGGAPFAGRARRQLSGFISVLEKLRQGLDDMDLPSLIDEVLETTGYRLSLLNSDEADAEDRLDNLRELRAAASDYQSLDGRSGLTSFLETIALVSEQDSLAEDEDQYLTLITLHQIKGLEYPAVFITGFEEGLLPHFRSLDDPWQLEEERRLAYVGITRSKEHLYLFRALRRRIFGQYQASAASRFLSDIPYQLTRGLDRQRGVNSSGIAPEIRPGFLRSTSSSDSSAPFQAGDKVNHDTFGKGIVVSCVPQTSDYEVTVAFSGGAGVKRLLNGFANLVKVASS